MNMQIDKVPNLKYIFVYLIKTYLSARWNQHEQGLSSL